MNLTQLKVFAGIMEEHSFSRAAERMYLSQPTVSAHIRALEAELQVKLFRRGGRDIQILDSARELYPLVQKMLRTEEEIHKQFDRRESGGKILRVAASSIPGQYVLPGVLNAFASRYAHTQISLCQTDSQGVLDGVTEGNYDLGFVGTCIPSEGLEFQPFFEDELVIIAPDAEPYHQVSSRELPVSVVEQAPVIFREQGSGTRAETEQYLRSAGIQPEQLHLVAVMDNPENIKKAVENGMGISFLSRLAAQDYVSSKKVLSYHLKDISMKRKLYMVYNKNQYLTEEAVYLMKLVRKFARNL